MLTTNRAGACGGPERRTDGGDAAPESNADEGDGFRGEHSGYYDRIRSMADEAERERKSFVPPAESELQADERALSYLRTGLGPVVSLYVEARTADRDVEFSAAELTLLDRAVNDWLALYTRCYGVETEPEFTIREAAELLVQTHNVRDTAQLLTCVPARR